MKIKKNKFNEIINTKGNIFKILDKNSKNFLGFSELYSTAINKNAVKGWKFHNVKTSNLMVIRGRVKIYYSYEKEPSKSRFIEMDEYSNFSLIIPNKVWFALKGCMTRNIILNFSNKINDRKNTRNFPFIK